MADQQIVDGRMNETEIDEKSGYNTRFEAQKTTSSESKRQIDDFAMS
jgi:hypothetical protein